MYKIIKKRNYSLHIIEKINRLISIKRIFFLDAKHKCVSGRHAHKKCTQVLFHIKGKINVEIFNGKITSFKQLSKSKKFIVIKPRTWVSLSLKKNDLCMVLCNRKYESQDYIYSKNQLLTSN
jgi:hypothetical protein